MAREQELISEIRQSERPQFEITESNNADVIVDTMVQFLRECFLEHPIYPYIPREDTFGPDWESTRIVITDEYTDDAVFLPTIVLKIQSINPKWIQFSHSPFKTVLKFEMNSDGTIKTDPNTGKPIPSHWEYVGSYEGSVNFIISANDTIEREELTNLLSVIFAESGRDPLYMRGIFVKGVSAGSPTEVEFRNDFIYQQAVSVDIYTEWRRKIPVGETLESIGYLMNVIDPTDVQSEEPQFVEEGFLPVYNLETTHYVTDANTDTPALTCFELDPENFDSPVTLKFNATSLQWEVSPFWIQVLEETLIPWENMALDINKEDPIAIYLEHAGKAILQATAARAKTTSSGKRVLPDGTIVVDRDTLVYEDGRVDLNKFGGEEQLIESTIVEADNTVVFRLSKTNKNRSILKIKNIVLDSEGIVTSGELYRVLPEGDKQITTSGEVILLDGAGYNSMTAVDLFLIFQFANQPYKYTLAEITDTIDTLIDQLADTSLTISNRMAKTNSLVNIKQELLGRSERFYLTQPVGL